MILEIDAGNTTLKWRLLDQCQQVSARGIQGYSEELSAITAQLGGGAITCMRIACVAGSGIGMRLKQWAHDDLGVEVKFASTLKHYAGVTVAYDAPSRLGVDRWLAMLAAYGEGAEPVCIIDAGSAITVDLLAGDGEHLGGYIVPGLKMLRRSLLEDTGQIILSGQEQPDQLAWGKSTDEAVDYGTYKMAVSFLQSIVDELKDSGHCWSLYVTGGDGRKVMSAVSTDFVVIYDSDLVFRGLAIALPEQGLVE